MQIEGVTLENTITDYMRQNGSNNYNGPQLMIPLHSLT